jgi:hypothetical protein
MIYNWNCLICWSTRGRVRFHYPGIVTGLKPYLNLMWANFRPEATAEEELPELLKPYYAAQWNAALYDDDCLFVVPGSHRRPRTKEERQVTLKGDGRGIMPGTVKCF